MSALHIVVLGAEGSGKTTLVRQLRSIAVEGSIICRPSSLVTAPTTGQEIDVLPMGEAPLRGPSTSLSKKDEALLAAEKGKTLVTLHEIGGRMAAAWPRFIASRLSQRHTSGVLPHSNGACGRDSALIFVIDGAAPWQLPFAVVELGNLLVGDTGAWSHVLIAINKRYLPSSAPLALFEEYLCFLPMLHRCGSTCVSILEIDTWNGLGLGDVWEWVRTCCAANPVA
jgi:energy-coupling factor transporter ATP-binding protein EcfA2